MKMFLCLMLISTCALAQPASNECDYPRERDLAKLSPDELMVDYCKAETMAAAHMFVSVTLELQQMKSSARYRRKLSANCESYAKKIRKHVAKTYGTEPQCPAKDLSCITP